jgi:hypothetical protein
MFPLQSLGQSEEGQELQSQDTANDEVEAAISDISAQIDSLGPDGAQNLDGARRFVTTLTKISAFRRRNAKIFLVPKDDTDRVEELMGLDQLRIQVANLQDELISSASIIGKEIESIRLQMARIESENGTLSRFVESIDRQKADAQKASAAYANLQSRLENLSLSDTRTPLSSAEREALEKQIDAISQEIYNTPGTPVFDVQAATIEELLVYLEETNIGSMLASVNNREVELQNYRHLLKIEPILRNVQAHEVVGRSEIALIANAVDNYTSRLIETDVQKNNYTSTVTSVFAALVGGVILGFYVLAFKNKDVQAQIFSGDRGIQFITLFSLVIAIILFGILGILEGKELSALLGGLSGYILGRGSHGNKSDDARPQPPPVPPLPANAALGAGAAAPAT